MNVLKMVTSNVKAIIKKNKYDHVVFLDRKSQIIDVCGPPYTPTKLLMYSLLKFYKKPNTLVEIAPIINRESHISLRLIDWFVTKYARDNSIVLPIYNKKTGNIKSHVFIYNSYKNRLKSYHGDYFEMYKRSNKIILEYGEEQHKLQTTAAQLNFFKWALENNIISYIKNNFQILGSELYISDRKYANNRLPTKIGKDECDDTIELTVMWDKCEEKVMKK